MRWHVTGILAWMLLLSACAEHQFTVLEEDRAARMQFRSVDLAEDVRRGTELGLLLRARVEDAAAAPAAFHARFSWMDREGVVLESNRYVQTITDIPVLDSLGEATGYFEPAISMAAAPVIRFDTGDGNYPTIVECFLPYHWLKVAHGAQTLQVRMEAVAGALPGDPGQDYAGVLDASRQKEVWGSMHLEIDLEWPKIYAARLRVLSLELEDSAFDPHQMDFSINTSNPQHGFPDLFWSLGLGYEQVFASTYWPNSLRGTWEAGTPVIYVRHRDEEVSLCAMDWDNERFFNNKHDQIGCWEGRLIQISTDTTQPTVLTFDRVRTLEVVMEWLEE